MLRPLPHYSPLVNSHPSAPGCPAHLMTNRTQTQLMHNVLHVDRTLDPSAPAQTTRQNRGLTTKP